MTRHSPKRWVAQPSVNGTDDGADALRGDEQRRRPFVAVEDHGRHLRHEGDERRADQDRDDHQRDHPAHVGVRPGEAEAVHQRTPHRPAATGRGLEAHRQHAGDHGEEADRVAPQRSTDAAERDRDPGQRRADDAAEVPLRVREPDGGDEVLAGHQAGQRVLERGEAERADGAGAQRRARR